MESEKILLVKLRNADVVAYEVYWTRWLILFTFVMLSIYQNLIWITFAPVTASTRTYFHTSNFTVNATLALGCILFIPSVFVVMYMLEQQGGIRKTVLAGALLCLSGACIRLIAIFFPTSDLALAFVAVGQALNAIAGPVFMACPSYLSATWFAESERGRATAILSTFSGLGSSASLVIAPYIVKATSMPTFLIGEAVLGILICIPPLFWFPNAPPSPPSRTAAIDRIKLSSSHPTIALSELILRFLRDVARACADPSFIVVVLVGGATGISGVWAAMLDQILLPLGFSQTQVGWISFGSQISSPLGGLFVGILADSLFHRRLKLLTLLMLWVAGLLLFLFMLCFASPVSSVPALPASNAFAFITAALSGIFFGGSLPVFYEMSADLAYPVPEGTSAGLLTLSYNVFGLILLAVGSLIPVNWINSVVVLTMIACVIAVLPIKERYPRGNEEKDATVVVSS